MASKKFLLKKGIVQKPRKSSFVGMRSTMASPAWTPGDQQQAISQADCKPILRAEPSLLEPFFPLPKDAEDTPPVMEMCGDNRFLFSYQDIPRKYFDSHVPAVKLISQWFFAGLSAPNGPLFAAKQGIDGKLALRVIGNTLTSIKSDHDHKMAACAYMLDAWFEILWENV